VSLLLRFMVDPFPIEDRDELAPSHGIAIGRRTRSK
jgi:hypothetical protein